MASMHKACVSDSKAFVSDRPFGTILTDPLAGMTAAAATDSSSTRTAKTAVMAKAAARGVAETAASKSREPAAFSVETNETIHLKAQSYAFSTEAVASDTAPPALRRTVSNAEESAALFTISPLRRNRSVRAVVSPTTGATQQQFSFSGKMKARHSALFHGQHHQSAAAGVRATALLFTKHSQLSPEESWNLRVFLFNTAPADFAYTTTPQQRQQVFASQQKAAFLTSATLHGLFCCCRSFSSCSRLTLQQRQQLSSSTLRSSKKSKTIATRNKSSKKSIWGSLPSKRREILNARLAARIKFYLQDYFARRGSEAFSHGPGAFLMPRAYNRLRTAAAFPLTAAAAAAEEDSFESYLTDRENLSFQGPADGDLTAAMVRNAEKRCGPELSAAEEAPAGPPAAMAAPTLLAEKKRAQEKVPRPKESSFILSPSAYIHGDAVLNVWGADQQQQPHTQQQQIWQHEQQLNWQQEWVRDESTPYAFESLASVDGYLRCCVDVADVSLNADGSVAKVFVSVDGDVSLQRLAFFWLQRARKMLRFHLSRQLRRRKKIPELYFYLLDLEGAARMLSALHRLEREEIIPYEVAQQGMKKESDIQSRIEEK